MANSEPVPGQQPIENPSEKRVPNTPKPQELPLTANLVNPNPSEDPAGDFLKILQKRNAQSQPPSAEKP